MRTSDLRRMVRAMIRTVDEVDAARRCRRDRPERNEAKYRRALVLHQIRPWQQAPVCSVRVRVTAASLKTTTASLELVVVVRFAFLNRAIMRSIPHLMTLAELSPAQIQRVITHARYLKQVSLPWLAPQSRTEKKLRMPSQSLFSKSVALLFSKRSTRTRIAAETAATLLGGRALFLGREDIQLGVNESMRDSARVIGGMCQGIFARVGDHSEIEVRQHTLPMRPRLVCSRRQLRNSRGIRLFLY